MTKFAMLMMLAFATAPLVAQKDTPASGQTAGSTATQNAGTGAAPQSGGTPDEGAVPAGTEPATEREVANPIIGDAPRASWGEQIRRTNFFLTTVAASTHIDDNALNNNSNPVVDAISTFEPRFAWNLARARWDWAVDYSPQLSYSVNLPNYNSFAHHLDSGFRFIVSPRFTVRLRNSFARTSDPFSRTAGSNLVPAFGVLDRPNQSFFGPPTTSTSEQVGGDATYALAPHTSVGITGTFY